MKRTAIRRHVRLKRGTSRLIRRTPLKRSTKRLKRSPLRRGMRKSGIREMRDGRVIYYGKKYTGLRADKWEEQGHRCKKCGRLMKLFEMDLHHPGGRGLGGGTRDDRNVVGLCNIPRRDVDLNTGKRCWLPRGCHTHFPGVDPFPWELSTKPNTQFQE